MARPDEKVSRRESRLFGMFGRFRDVLERVSTNSSIIRSRIITFVEGIQEKSQASMLQSKSVCYTEVVNYIEENYKNSLFGMVDIADFLGVSIYTASRLLKKATNVNFRTFINDKRIEYAKELLLNTDYSIAEVAQMSGFSSTTYFNKVFKESTGIAHNNYKANYAIDNEGEN